MPRYSEGNPVQTHGKVVTVWRKDADGLRVLVELAIYPAAVCGWVIGVPEPGR